MSSTDVPRLSSATLGKRRPEVAGPAYDRRSVKAGIVHLGLGAFFRAHGAVYTDDMLADGDHDWGIVGVSLQRPDQRDRLQPQDGLYTLVEKDGDRKRARIIGSVLDVLVAPEDPGAVVARIAAETTQIVTLTVTEKGYCHDPATGRLSQTHADIVHDLATPERPRSAVGMLVAALALRRAAGLAPPTVVSCDNLPHNGRLLAGLVHDFAQLRDPSLASWIAQHGAFPSTMVDRIVPATTADDVRDAEALTGLADAAPVMHEPFSQWVIEDTFVGGRRPRWERAGAELVTDVAPFEAMKLQMLNGSHSALAYLGYLGGHATIGACVADPVYRRYAERLWRDEIIPVTTAPPGVDLAAYARQLMDRFSNQAIQHRTWQIAMDGSQKLPQRLLATIQRRLAQNLPIDGLACAVAAWVRYVGGADEQGRPIDVRDPMAETLARTVAAADGDPARTISAVAGVGTIFDRALASDPRFLQAVSAAYADLLSHGARASLARRER